MLRARIRLLVYMKGLLVQLDLDTPGLKLYCCVVLTNEN